MKKMLGISAIILMLLISSSTVFSQTESKGDTLLVGPLNSDGQALGALNEAIKADTTADGERAHKVYKLQRNAQYILTEIIQADFPLVIVADEPDDTNRPPIIRCGLTEDGGTVQNWWHIFDDATFKNLWMSGINLEGTGGISWITQTVNTTGKTISYEGCIIEAPYTNWAMFADFGSNNVYKTKNCIFKNVGNPTGTTWNGAIFAGGTIDSVIHKNTTFFNFGCFATNGTTFYVEVDHCTFINSVVHPVESHGDVIKKYTNNVWINCHAFSDDQDEIKRHYDQEVKGLMNYAEIQFDPQRLDSLYGPGGAYEKQYDPNGDGVLTEDEMVWELKNNVWYYTQPIKDYWAQFPEVTPNPWMNNYNKAMFENQDGPWTWELWTFERDTNDVIIDSSLVVEEHQPFRFFVEENTYNVDPGIVDMNNCDELLAQNCINIRTEWAGGTVDNPVKWHNVDDYLDFTWPLDFDLSYTNDMLLTASTRGFPLGDLYHWFPEIYETGVEEQVTPTPSEFVLEANYPNPFNPTTTINYQINKPGLVNLAVYNVLGEKVKTLVNRHNTAGRYDITWNGTDDAGRVVSTGVYFYRLEMGDNIEMRKMMLIK